MSPEFAQYYRQPVWYKAMTLKPEALGNDDLPDALYGLGTYVAPTKETAAYWGSDIVPVTVDWGAIDQGVIAIVPTKDRDHGWYWLDPATGQLGSYVAQKPPREKTATWALGEYLATDHPYPQLVVHDRRHATMKKKQ